MLLNFRISIERWKMNFHSKFSLFCVQFMRIEGVVCVTYAFFRHYGCKEFGARSKLIFPCAFFYCVIEWKCYALNYTVNGLIREFITKVHISEFGKSANMRHCLHFDEAGLKGTKKNHDAIAIKWANKPSTYSVSDKFAADCFLSEWKTAVASNFCL